MTYENKWLLVETKNGAMYKGRFLKNDKGYIIITDVSYYDKKENRWKESNCEKHYLRKANILNMWYSEVMPRKHKS